MNRGGAFDESSSSSSIQQMMRNVNNMRPPHLPLIPSPSSSTTISSSSSAASASSPSSSSVLFPQCSQISNLQLMSTPWLDNQDFPESWRQLLLGDLVEEDKRCNLRPPFQTKNIENWEQYQVQAYPPSSDNIVDVKKELLYEQGYNTYSSQRCEEIQATRSPWSQILPNSSPRSCITTTSFNSSMLDFSNNNNNSNNHKAAGTKHHHQDPSSQECNSPQTGLPYKKARAQPSTQSTFKVRKEKLGDRITALHQLVSPFGKTDTASVLLEAIGYIRFLQSQVEALSSPYLAAISAKMKQQQQQQQHHHLAQGESSCIFPEDPGQLLNVDNCMKRIGAPDQDGGDQEPKKDLRSRGLCLVPVSFTMHVGSDNGAGYWAPTFGGGFR